MKSFKTSKYDYNENKKIAHVRHTNTEYDKYDVFFHVFLGERKKLNWNCYQFLNEDISTADFIEAQNNLITEVNLNKKDVQKRLFNKYIIDLRTINPEASNNFIKNTAKKMVQRLIGQQERRNLKRANRERLYFKEDEEIDMYQIF